MFKECDFSYKNFTYIFKNLDMIDGLISLIYDSKKEETEEEKTKRIAKIDLLLSTKESYIILSNLLYYIKNNSYPNFLWRFFNKLEAIFISQLRNGKKINTAKYIFLYLSRIIKRVDSNNEFSSLISEFNKYFSYCFKVYNGLRLNPYPKKEKDPTPRLKFFEKEVGLKNIYVDFDMVFKDVKRVCMVHGCMKEKEVDNTMIVDLFLRYCKLMEKTNGETSGSLL